MTRILQLEDSPNGRKQGVDDFLAGGGTVEDLCSLTEDYSPEVFTLEENPVLAEEALYGLPGDVARTIKDHTEADPVAILMEFLSRAGNLIGRGAHFIVEGDTHYMKINYVSVGSTSKGRKGTASGRIDRVMEQVDQWWVDNCVDTGLSSGEGLIKRIADKNPPKDEDSDEEDDGEDFDPGEVEKRLYVQEPEFGSMLTVMAREGNSLSSVIRNAWDDRPLRSMVKKDPLQSTNSHVTIVGHVTKEELIK